MDGWTDVSIANAVLYYFARPQMKPISAIRTNNKFPIFHKGVVILQTRTFTSNSNHFPFPASAVSLASFRNVVIYSVARLFNTDR